MRALFFILILCFSGKCFAQLDSRNAKQDTTLVVKFPGYSKDALRANLRQEVALKDGFWQISLKDRKGNLVELISYEDKELSIRKGPYQLYKGDQLQLEGNFDKGYKVGLWKSYHTNGLPSIFSTYKWDKFWGNYQEFNEQGREKIQGFYINNKKAGKWTFFDEQGRTIKEENYDEEGRLVSTNLGQ